MTYPLLNNLCDVFQHCSLSEYKLDEILHFIHQVCSPDLNSLLPKNHQQFNKIRRTIYQNDISQFHKVLVFKDPDLYLYFRPLVDTIHSKFLSNSSLYDDMQWDFGPLYTDNIRYFSNIRHGIFAENVVSHLTHLGIDLSNSKILWSILHSDETLVTLWTLHKVSFLSITLISNIHFRHTLFI